MHPEEEKNKGYMKKAVSTIGYILLTASDEPVPARPFFPTSTVLTTITQLPGHSTQKNNDILWLQVLLPTVLITKYDITMLCMLEPVRSNCAHFEDRAMTMLCCHPVTTHRPWSRAEGGRGGGLGFGAVCVVSSWTRRFVVCDLSVVAQSRMCCSAVLTCCCTL